MAQFTEPKAGEDVRELHKIVAQHSRALNALGNCKINPNGQQNTLTLSESNATLELALSTSGTGTKKGVSSGSDGSGNALPETLVDFIVNGQVQQWKINGEPA